MNHYKLYYWPLPFRGNFPRLILEQAGVAYEMSSMEETVTLKNQSPSTQGIPAMAPPIIHDLVEDKWLNQMPVIVMSLAESHQLLPPDQDARALTLKTILDCNDLLSDLTNANGNQMWQHDNWVQFRSARFPRWLEIFEENGKRHGLELDSSYFLGNKTIEAADLVLTAMFATLTRCISELKEDVCQHAPRISNLCDRVSSQPAISRFFEGQQAETGDLYCGGQIEQSIRDMIKRDGS